MKKLLTLTILLSILVASTSGWALTISSNEVGAVDSLIEGGTPDGTNPDDEALWASQILGFDVTFQNKTEDNLIWLHDSGSSLYAMDLNGTPAYFVLKTGGGNGLGLPYTHYLYSNAPSTGWAVIDLNLLGDAFTDFDRLEIGVVSHVSEFGGTPVPEPGTMVLLGAGFLGLAIYGKRRRNS